MKVLLLLLLRGFFWGLVGFLVTSEWTILAGAFLIFLMGLWYGAVFSGPSGHPNSFYRVFNFAVLFESCMVGFQKSIHFSTENTAIKFVAVITLLFMAFHFGFHFTSSRLNRKKTKGSILSPLMILEEDT